MKLTLSFEKRVDLQFLRNVFLCFALGAVLFIPLDFVFLSRASRAEASLAGTSSQSQAPLNPPLNPLSLYEEALKTSRIFGFMDAQAPLAVIQSSIAELVKDLRLKGVVILDEAEAIIEDARTQKSTFVKAGDKVGELTVKEIKEGAIVLTYYGEEKELRIE